MSFDSGEIDFRMKDETEEEGKQPSASDDSKPVKKARKLDFHSIRAEKDLIDGRYQISFSSGGSPLKPTDARKAGNIVLEVIDKEGEHDKLYAVALDPAIPYRADAIHVYQEYNGAHLQPFVAHGIANISSLNACRYCIVFKPIVGKPLSSLFSVTRTLTEKLMIETIIKPVFSVINHFSSHDILIGNINLDSIFIDPSGKVMVAEFLTFPCGYAQNHFYETLERIICGQYGKGTSNPNVDLFALASVVIHSNIGVLPALQSLSAEDIIMNRFLMGSYNSLMGPRTLPGVLEDLIRGCLNDTFAERWDYEKLSSWLNSKKFNIIRPSPPKESTRSFTFNGAQMFNRRHLAFVLSKNWKEARTELRDDKIARWLQLSVAMPDQADFLRRIVHSSGGEYTRSVSADDELVSKSLVVLDPNGPMRFREISVILDGIGMLLADLYRSRRVEYISYIAKFIENDLIGFIADVNPDLAVRNFNESLKVMDKCRQILRNTSFGFGIERLLYDLNSHLPCQSNIVINDHALTLEDLLYSLDSHGNERRDIDPMDRHIAAFIAHHIALDGEIRTGAEQNTAFKNNAQITMLALLNRAQNRSKNIPLPGLTKWLGSRLSGLADSFHSRTLRKQMVNRLKEASESGIVERIYKLFADTDIVIRDQNGYNQATRLYQKYKQAIARMSSIPVTESVANLYAMRLCLLLSLFIALMTMYNLLGGLL